MSKMYCMNSTDELVCVSPHGVTFRVCEAFGPVIAAPL